MLGNKITIVLPVYNGADHIVDSINSILAQTYKNWELIIVNDGSTDNTLAICQDIAKRDNRITVISNNKNLKLPNSLNVGFEMATGEYYTWTSDDNMYRPEALDVMIRAIQQDSEAVMVYANYTNIDSEGKTISKAALQDPEYIVTGNIFGACFMYTSKVAKLVGKYDSNLFLAEDYDYWMRIYRHGKIIHISEDLYLYRRHDNSLTETKKASINEQTYKAIEKNFLPLYMHAKQTNLENLFFDNILRRGEAHKKETKGMLITVNGKYKLYLYKLSMKNRIRQTKVFDIYRKLKSKGNGSR